MTAAKLLKSLKMELEEAVKDFKFITQYAEPSGIQFHIQTINRSLEEVSSYPFVVVELIGVSDEAEGSVASVLITVGVYYGEGDSGFLDLLNLIEVIRGYILGHSVIGGEYLLMLPVETGLVEKRSDNFLYANIFVTYRIAGNSFAAADF